METGTNMTAIITTATAPTSNATSNAPTIPTSSAHNDQPHEFREPVSGAILRGLMRDGEPWFVAKDVAQILELGNPRTSLALLDEDEKDVHSMDTLGGKQEMSIISEAGL